MFLDCRSRQAEYFDEPQRSAAQVADSFRQLARVNRLFRFSQPFELAVPALLGTERCRELSLLDLGAGDGSLGRALIAWAANQGWQWKVTNFDLNPFALALNPQGENVVGSVLKLPFENLAFDVVIASQMTHHLIRDDEVVQHFREAWRVSRQALILSDLHRNAMLYGMVWASTLALGLSRELREDGLLSVKRGFRVGEWQGFAGQAGIAQPKVWVYGGSRIMLQARKQSPPQI
jgi:2-polyprenyl-3-methyl-5-hydroxy-6-metoxy-1,4-benzoquinol methylase